MMPLQLVIDGVATNAAEVYDDLPRAVLISLFTWRRANADDVLPSTDRYGWWGDSFASVDNDRIGSRLWLLQRAKLANDTAARAREYAAEALQWLVDDGVAESVSVTAERLDLQSLALGVVIVRGDKTKLSIRFVNVWDYLTPSAAIAAAFMPATLSGSTEYLTDANGNILIDANGNMITVPRV